MELQLVGYSDLAHGGEANSEDNRATYGRVFLLQRSPVLWALKHSNSVSLTNAKSEFMDAKEVTLQSIHLRSLLEEMGEVMSVLIPLYLDDWTAITLFVTENCSRCIKHVAIAVQWLR